MATLKDRLQSDLHDAMRARDDVRRSTVRMLSSAIHNAEIEARGELDEDAVLAVVQKQAKQRRESIDEYRRAGRSDLVDREEAELRILETYLPAQASDDDIRDAARTAIADTGASGPADLGKVMPVLMQQFAGRADGKRVNAIVRELLASS